MLTIKFNDTLVTTVFSYSYIFNANGNVIYKIKKKESRMNA